MCSVQLPPYRYPIVVNKYIVTDMVFGLTLAIFINPTDKKINQL